MSESIHDIALKLGLLNDAASFAAGEQLVDNFTQATIRSNERIKASNTELQRSRAQDRLDNEAEKIRLKHRSPTQVADESMERLDTLFMSTAMSAKVYEKELENIYNTWNDITRAQAANTVILQQQQNVQSLAVERTEDEIVRQQQLLELKQDIINRTIRLQKTEANAEYGIHLIDPNIIARATTATEYLISAEERRDNAIKKLQQDVALAARTNTEYAKGLNLILAAYDKDVEQKSPHALLTNDKRTREIEQAAKATEHLTDVETRRNKALKQLDTDVTLAGRSLTELYRGQKLINDQYDREATTLKTTNPLRKQAEGLLNQYRNIVDRTAEDITILNARLADGTITVDEHSRAIANANQRLAQMRHGAGNTIYAIGELGRGLEDFVTVMSITGMNAQGFGMAMRGASNNISQAASLMSGASGAMIGSFAGIAALAVGQLVSYLFRATSQSDLLTIALEKNKTAIEAMSNTRTKAIDQKNTMFDIMDIKTAEEARGKVTKDLPREIEKQKEELKKIQQEIIVNEQKQMATLFGGPDIVAGLRTNIQQLRDIGKAPFNVGAYDEAADAIAAALTKANQGIQTSNDALIQGAIEDFEKIGRIYGSEIAKLEGSAAGSLLYDMGANKTGKMLAGDNLPFIMEKNISDVLAGQLKDKEKMAEIEAATTKLKTDELASIQAIKDLEEQRLKTAEQLAILSKVEFDNLQKIDENKLNNIRIETDREAKQQSLVNQYGKKDEQGFLQDYSIKYSDLMNTAGLDLTVNTSDRLNNIFDEQLNTRYAELDNQLQGQMPDVSVDTSTALQALGSANEQIMKAMGPDKNQAIIDELKAIQEAFNRNMFPVERLN